MIGSTSARCKRESAQGLVLWQPRSIKGDICAQMLGTTWTRGEHPAGLLLEPALHSSLVNCDPLVNILKVLKLFDAKAHAVIQTFDRCVPHSLTKIFPLLNPQCFEPTPGTPPLMPVAPVPAIDLHRYDPQLHFPHALSTVNHCTTCSRRKYNSQKKRHAQPYYLSHTPTEMCMLYLYTRALATHRSANPHRYTPPSHIICKLRAPPYTINISQGICVAQRLQAPCAVVLQADTFWKRRYVTSHTWVGRQERVSNLCSKPTCPLEPTYRPRDALRNNNMQLQTAGHWGCKLPASRGTHTVGAASSQLLKGLNRATCAPGGEAPQYWYATSRCQRTGASPAPMNSCRQRGAHCTRSAKQRSAGNGSPGG